MYTSVPKCVFISAFFLMQGAHIFPVENAHDINSLFVACQRSTSEMFKWGAHSLWRQSGYLPYDYVYEDNNRARVPPSTVFRKQCGGLNFNFIVTPGKELQVSVAMSEKYLYN